MDPNAKRWIIVSAGEPWCRYDDSAYESEDDAVRVARRAVGSGESDLAVAQLTTLVESPRRGVHVRKLK
jgi:hypothetical protein